MNSLAEVPNLKTPIEQFMCVMYHQVSQDKIAFFVNIAACNSRNTPVQKQKHKYKGLILNNRNEDLNRIQKLYLRSAYVSIILAAVTIVYSDKYVEKMFSSTLKMEAIYSSETSVPSQQSTRRHIPEDDTLHNHRCENLKSYITWSTGFLHWVFIGSASWFQKIKIAFFIMNYVWIFCGYSCNNTSRDGLFLKSVGLSYHLDANISNSIIMMVKFNYDGSDMLPFIVEL
jgi:hypothetical protein